MGSCHVERTTHAGAFISKNFQETVGSPAEAECQQCHAPLDINAGKTEARSSCSAALHRGFLYRGVKIRSNSKG